MTIRIMTAALAALTALAAAGCASTPNVSYGDPRQVETVALGFGSTDLQQIAARMTDSLLSQPALAQRPDTDRPVIIVDRVRNKTTEHIDTESVTDTISTRLLRSGRFRFADMSQIQNIEDQINHQTASGLVDPATAIRLGKLIGADYMLYGNLSAIEKRGGRLTDVYYKFTLRLLDLETGLVEWMDEKEIRKQEKRRLLGP
jgi:penicillin-binding protein activator